MDAKGLTTKGHSTSKLRFFDRTTYAYLKNKMQVFPRTKDYEIWKVVSRGPFELLEDENVWTREQIRTSTSNWSLSTLCSVHFIPLSL